MKYFLYLFFLTGLFNSLSLSGQQPIDVTENTLKIKGLTEEVFYYGFAEGDKIVFNFQEIKKKELKEIEIAEYPNNSKFSDYKTKKVDNKIISVTKKSVYSFRFKNTSISGRICKIKIQRIPASESGKDFNTAVNWVTKQDTTWNTFTRDVVIGYDTIRIQKTKKVLIKTDTVYNPLFDKTLRVHSETAIGKSQYTYATVQLPQNTYEPNALNPYKSTEVIAWSYWLGVGQKAKEEYEKANKKISSGVKVLGVLSGYGALATLVSTGISMFGTPTVGDNVHYKFYGMLNGEEITIDYGNVVAASARNENIKQGGFNIQLYNDNFKDGIDVTVKMIVMQVTKTWKDLSYIEQNLKPRYEKQLFKEPVINTYVAPVTGL